VAPRMLPAPPEEEEQEEWRQWPVPTCRWLGYFGFVSVALVGGL
jgi:hypothetical protein